MPQTHPNLILPHLSLAVSLPAGIRQCGPCFADREEYVRRVITFMDEARCSGATA